MHIIEAGPKWADKYRLFCQKAYRAAYLRPELGVTEDFFSDEVFGSRAVRDYFGQLFAAGHSQRAWLALDDSDDILGGVTASYDEHYCEMKGFYVAKRLQGQGIGSQLFEKVLDFAKGRPIQVDVVNYMTDTIELYKHWGFRGAPEKGYVIYHQYRPEVRDITRGIYLIRPGASQQ